jgi:hypothetical protein
MKSLNKSFTLRNKDGSSQVVKYEPLMYIAGDQVHNLALHKISRNSGWIVSDPACGAKVVTVDGVYKGVPCSSVGYPLKAARQLAMACLDELVSRVGSDTFNKVMTAKKPF